jgi:acyl-CoA thioester hydrolase
VKREFDSEIRNEKDELLTTAYFLLVFVDINLGKPIAPPQYILDVLKN